VTNILKILIFISFTFINASAFSASNTEIQQNIIQINRYFDAEKETLDYDDVVKLSRKIIQNRQFYNNNIVAKVFLLLADAASSKGDLARAMQFALDGKSLVAIEKSLELPLLLKIAKGYYIKGKFHRVKDIAQQAVSLASQINNIPFLLKALSFRAMANALIGEHQLALNDLQQVELLLADNREFSDHIDLLEVLAIAHFYLNDHQAAVTFYNRILKLRFELSQKNNIGLTYYSLARSYVKLAQLDNAYNAYWEAKQHAVAKNAPIRIAYAQLGLGQVLLLQQQQQLAFVALKEAEQLFHGQNLTKPYLSTLIALAKVTMLLDKNQLSFQYLEQAVAISENVELTNEQIELYLLLSTMHQKRKEFEKALIAQQEYVKKYKHFVSHNVREQANGYSLSAQSRQLSLNLAEESELRAYFSTKFTNQELIINLLIVVLILLLMFALYLSLKLRAFKLNQAYEDIEKPIDFLASPSQTKKLYQRHYKMARKYEFPLIIGYLSVDNWQELTFHFSKKIVNEVAGVLATLVNEHSGEFDQVGLINEGEYLFLCPYQTSEDLQVKLAQLTKALKLRFFANLGDFSIKISYAYQTPSIQDIDPYIFLSRLSEATRTEFKT
jgi:tetratricopeptide (TPR) repeat protein